MSEYWTSEDIARVAALVASSESSVQYEDRKVVYRGQEEMLSLLTRMRASVAGTQQGGMRITYGVHGKGL